MFGVNSEVGRLRQVVLHRPGLELKRLTPDNAADLLFDDVLWVSRAQAEHDAFAGALASRGVVDPSRTSFAASGGRTIRRDRGPRRAASGPGRGSHPLTTPACRPDC